MLENSGAYHGRVDVAQNTNAKKNTSHSINANTAPVNMTIPLRSPPMNFNPMHNSSQSNNVNSHFSQPNNFPLNMSTINLGNSYRMHAMGSYDEMIHQHNQLSLSSHAHYLNVPTHTALTNGNSMPIYNHANPPFNYYSNPMNLGYSSKFKDDNTPIDVICETGNDETNFQEVETTSVKKTSKDICEIFSTENENTHEKVDIKCNAQEKNDKELSIKNNAFENTGYNENIKQISYNKNPFICDVHGVTKEHFQEKCNMAKCTIVNTNDSYDEATKLVSEDRTDSQKVFQCQHCNLLFRNAKRFVVHYKWHSFGKLNEIRKRHFEEAKTRKKNSKSDSEEVKDDKDSEEELSCEICNQKYPTKTSLKNHMRRVHFGRSKECPICHKTFHNRTYLKSHMTTHTEEKKFMCDECPKTFKFVHSLMRHRPTHFKEKNFSCPMCDKSFGSRLLLKIHSKTHERIMKGTEFRCTYCGKGFYQAYTLAIHERTHTGEKPFKCDICHSAYGTNSSLQRHLKVSHNNESKPFECTICQRVFSTDAMLDRHYLRAHPEPECRIIPCQFCTDMFHSQTQCDAHTNKVHMKPDTEPQRRKRRKKQPEVIGHVCP